MKPPAVQPPTAQPEEISLNFEAQDIRNVISFILRDVLRETFTISGQVAGNVTLSTAKPIPRSALIPTLETILRQNGAALVREDNIWKIVPIAQAVRGTTTPQLLPTGGQLKPGFSVILVPLKFTGVNEMKTILDKFAIDPSAVQVDPLRNMLVLTGTQRELKHLLDTIDMFDVDWLAGMSVGVFTLRSVDVKTVQTELNQLLGPQGPLAGIVRLIPLERLNGFLMITTQPRYLDKAREWLDKLDSVAGTSGGQRLFVYQVQNSKAETLAKLLGDIFGRGAQTTTPAPQLAPGLRPANLASGPSATPIPGSTTPAPQTPAAPGAGTANIQGGVGVSKDVRVIADTDNNALLILSTAADYEVIESALRKLDIVQRQVLLEVTYAQVTLNDKLKYGVDWYLSNLGRDGINSANPGMGSTAIINTTGGLSIKDGVVSAPLGSTFGGGIQVIRNVAGGLRAVVNALDAVTNTKILSNPQVVVADNKQVSFNSGRSISVNTGTTATGTTTGTVTTNQYVSTGTILNITPRVNAGGMVALEIDAEVSAPGDLPPGAAAGSNPPIDRNTLKTSVAVQSGETIFLGGIIAEQKRRNSGGVPVLSRVPLIGGLFGTQGIETDRNELLIAITPKVIANVEQNRAVIDELRSKFQGLNDSLPKKTGQGLNNEVDPSVFRSLKLEPLIEEKK